MKLLKGTFLKLKSLRYHKKVEKADEMVQKKLGIRGIRAKLLVAFAIPVLFIIALGIISYNKALYGIVNHYEDAVQETMVATGKYFVLGFKSIDATATQLSVDDKLQDPAEFGSYKGVHKSIIAKMAADKFISNIHVFSVKGVEISTKTGAMKEDIYTEFISSEEGKLFQEKTDTIWVGTHTFIDTKFKTDRSKYGLSVMKKIKNSSGFSGDNGEVIGFIIIDINLDAVQEVLNGFHWGEGSIAGFITSDGREINNLKDKGQVFSSQSFYQNALVSSDSSGSSYVTYLMLPLRRQEQGMQEKDLP